MLSIIIIEYNSVEDVKSFVLRLKELSLTDYEVIVSSNSLYPEKKMGILRESMPDVIWLRNPKNGGFAYGMNEGIRCAKGDIIMISNPDVKIKSSLEPIMNYLKNQAEVGIIAPKIVDADGVIQDSFRHFITPLGFILRQIGWIKDKGKLHVKNFQEPVKGDWVIGAFMMCRRDFYEKVGGLSDDYFMYCEDMDWCKRAHKAGYEVVYFPETVIEYKGTRSARKSWKYAKIHIKSLLTYWRKFGIV